MQFFDLSQQFNLSNILTPYKTLDDLAKQEWVLSKVRIEHDCLSDQDNIEGQVVLKSNENIQIELEWLIQDTEHELLIQFKGIETPVTEETFVLIKGESRSPLSSSALSLWLDGTLFPLLPQLRQQIKARLNLWDYVEYDD